MMFSRPPAFSGLVQFYHETKFIAPCFVYVCHPGVCDGLNSTKALLYVYVNEPVSLVFLPENKTMSDSLEKTNWQ